MSNSEFTGSQYSEAYPEGAENHFWHLARNRLIAAHLRRVLPATGRVLEIGCGPGIVLRHLRDVGIDCWGCELGTPPIPEPLQPFVFVDQNCLQLDAAFRYGIDVILLFDVLEHIEDDVGFLRSLADAFPNSRALIVTVPARAELWSNYDTHYGHFRRYDRVGLASALKQGGFTIERQRYFFHELYLPVLLATKRPAQRDTAFQAPTNTGLHRFLSRVSFLFSSLLPPQLPGTSLIAVATAKSAQTETRAASAGKVSS